MKKKIYWIVVKKNFLNILNDMIVDIETLSDNVNKSISEIFEILKKVDKNNESKITKSELVNWYKKEDDFHPINMLSEDERYDFYENKDIIMEQNNFKFKMSDYYEEMINKAWDDIEKRKK